MPETAVLKNDEPVDYVRIVCGHAEVGITGDEGTTLRAFGQTFKIECFCEGRMIVIDHPMPGIRFIHRVIDGVLVIVAFVKRFSNVVGERRPQLQPSTAVV